MRAALVAAAMLTTALVLGEYAFASLLLKSTLPTQMLVYAGSDPRGGLALALFVMIVTALCLGIVVRLMRKRGVSLPTTGF
jgi:putative spermidine/putrescine transport system permease protein